MSHDLQLILGTLGAVSTLLLPLYIWSIKTQLKISQTIYGDDGKNGLRGDVKDLKEDRDYVAGVAKEVQLRLDTAEKEIVRNRERYHNEFVPAINGQTHSNLKVAGALDHLAESIARKS